MFSLPFRRSPRNAGTIDALYGTIVAQARSPAFYRGYGVPDTVDARIDMIVLHLVLVLRRLRVGQSPGPLGQALFDRFCQDMDDNFREMGVGDLAVPKRMRRLAEAFYGRAKVYEAALASDETAALATAVARNVFGQAEPALGAPRLAAYMRATVDRLGAQADDAIGRAELNFPDPEAVAEPASRQDQQP